MKTGNRGWLIALRSNQKNPFMSFVQKCLFHMPGNDIRGIWTFYGNGGTRHLDFLWQWWDEMFGFLMAVVE